MEKSHEVWILMGVLASVVGIAFEVVYSVSQTDPAATDWNIISAAQGLAFVSVILLVNTYLEMKHQDCVAAAIGLFLIGSAGFALTVQFTNTIVNAFYPKTYVAAFIGADFLGIALAGICLPLIARTLERLKPVTSSLSQQ